MNKLTGLVLGAMAIVSGSAPAAPQWKVRELKMALDSAIELFREQKGEEKYQAISGLGIERGTQGISGNAKITYRVGAQKMAVSYFCHYHEGEEIDCH